MLHNANINLNATYSPQESNEWQRHYRIVRAIEHLCVFVAHEEQGPDQDMVHVLVSERLNHQ